MLTPPKTLLLALAICSPALAQTEADLPVRIQNRAELEARGLLPTDDRSYEVQGGVSRQDRLWARSIRITQRRGKEVIQLERFDGECYLRSGVAEVQIKDQLRALVPNSKSKLHTLLTCEGEAPATYRIRGWLIDVEGWRGVERMVLVDEISALWKGRYRVWVIAAEVGLKRQRLVKGSERTSPLDPQDLSLRQANPSNLQLIPIPGADLQEEAREQAKKRLANARPGLSGYVPGQ